MKTVKIVYASLYIHDNIKLLVDDNNILYHYIDHVPIGFIGKNKEAYFYYETQEEYDNARKHNDIIIKRISDEMLSCGSTVC